MSKYDSLLRDPIAKVPVYQPGKPIEIVAKEFGLEAESILKLASNENPLGTSPKAVAAMQAQAKEMWLYPENSCFFLREALSEKLGVSMDSVAVTAGSSDFFYLLGDLFIEPGVETVMGKGAFISYKIATLLYGGTPVEVPMPNFTHDLDAMRAAITDKTRLVFLACPNNPSGTVNSVDEIIAFAKSLPDHVVLILDEAYAEYRDEKIDLRELIAEGRKIMVTRTFSKIYGLAGLRIGYAYADPELVQLIDRVRPPFNVSSIALVAAQAALGDDEWVAKAKSVNESGLLQLGQGLAALGLDYIPSEGNFIMAKFGPSAANIYQEMQRRGIIVRPVAGYGYPEYLRISVGTSTQNEACLKMIADILATEA